MTNHRLNLSNTVSVIIDPDKITPKEMDELAMALAEVKQKHSIFAKYPLEDKETLEQWQERVLPILGEETRKKENETAEDYLKRIFYVEPDKKKVIYDTLNVLSTTFNKGKITEEVFNSASYVLMKNFIRDILKAIDFDTKDYE